MKEYVSRHYAESLINDLEVKILDFEVQVRRCEEVLKSYTHNEYMMCTWEEKRMGFIDRMNDASSMIDSLLIGLGEEPTGRFYSYGNKGEGI